MGATQGATRAARYGAGMGNPSGNLQTLAPAAPGNVCGAKDGVRGRRLLAGRRGGDSAMR